MEIEGLEKVKGLDSPNLSNLQTFLTKNKFLVLVITMALLLVGVGLFLLQGDQPEVEIIEDKESTQEIVVEISGEVLTPGVYSLTNGARIEDLLLAAGGISANADRDWMAKVLNRAAKLIDGQKIYIPPILQQPEVVSANSPDLYQSESSVIGASTQGLTNINSASLAELDKLPGIGPVYGQKIIDQRPYSNIEELQSKGVVPAKTYEKFKDLISVY